jgi:hypothetical protein
MVEHLYKCIEKGEALFETTAELLKGLVTSATSQPSNRFP